MSHDPNVTLTDWPALIRMFGWKAMSPSCRLNETGTEPIVISVACRPCMNGRFRLRISSSPYSTRSSTRPPFRSNVPQPLSSDQKHRNESPSAIRVKEDPFDRHIVFEAAVSQKQRIAGHRSRIIAPAFELVPWTSAFAVIPVAYRFDDFHAFGDLPFLNHMDRGLIFEAVHRFRRIRKRYGWLDCAFRPCADHEPGFVVQAVQAPRIENVPHACLEIMAVDGSKRLPRLHRIEYFAEAAKIIFSYLFRLFNVLPFCPLSAVCRSSFYNGIKPKPKHYYIIINFLPQLEWTNLCWYKAYPQLCVSVGVGQVSSKAPEHGS